MISAMSLLGGHGMQEKSLPALFASIAMKQGLKNPKRTQT